MFSAIALYIVVSINGQEYEAVPRIFYTTQECLQEEKLYTKDLVVESGCFEGVFVKKD